MKSEVEERDRQIEKLKNSLNELTMMKIEHENEMLQKFILLLNEKKMKIRDQQRLLSELKNVAEAVMEDNSDTLTQPKSVKVSKKPTKKPVKRSRRKANQVQSEEEEGQNDDNNTDTLDHPKPTIQTRKSTVNPTRRAKRKAEQIQSEEEEEEDEKNIINSTRSKPAAGTRKSTRQSKQKAYQIQSEEEEEEEGGDNSVSEVETEGKRAEESSNEAQKMASTISETESDEGKSSGPDSDVVIPPKRQLPFARKKTPPAKSPSTKPPVALSGSETESDDEL
ncbi:hypothetical protein K3495_g3616 [Podosphaera aphanis]|nr:hypothetical protein K3495_g3616 [Podosphaera aphanis]